MCVLLVSESFTVDTVRRYSEGLVERSDGIMGVHRNSGAKSWQPEKARRCRGAARQAETRKQNW